MSREAAPKKSVEINKDPNTRDWTSHLDVVEEAVQTPKYESLRNRLFEQYMERQLSGQFFEEAEDIGFSHEQIQEAQNTLARFSDAEILGALSLPHEIRENWLTKALESIESGRSTPAKTIEQLVGLGKKYGFGIGFHTSPQDIRPNDKGVWQIRGTEADHRDNDLSMAYYSNKYRHLFKAKGPRFIYVVRSDKNDRTDGNWSRAPSLSVIMRLPFAEVHQFVERSAREIEDTDSQRKGDE